MSSRAPFILENYLLNIGKVTVWGDAMIFRKGFKLAISTVVFLSLSLAAKGTIAYGDEATDLVPNTERSSELVAAVQFVRQTGANRNFKLFLSQAAARTTTLQGLVAMHGFEEVRPVLESEILSVISKYGDLWDENLASSYLEFFSPGELESILKDKQESPYAQKFRAEQDAVGRSMQKLSESILKDALGEVLLAVFESFAPDKSE